MDSNLNENQLNENLLYNQKSLLIENNSFNKELESKWNEIEEEKEKKQNKNKRYSKYTNLGHLSIMRINLDSLIHPIEDISKFDEYCKLKIKQLDKIKNKIENRNNINLSNINLEKIKIKSFLKTDNTDFMDNDSHIYNTKKESHIDKDKITKKKLNANKLAEIIDNDINNKSSIINMANCIDIFNISKNKSDKNLLMINNLTNILNNQKKSQSFLKSDDNNSFLDKKNTLLTNKNEILNIKYKQYFNNNNNFNINNNFSNKYYKYKKNINNNNNFGIKNKIEEDINNLYNLYPILKMKKEL